MNTIFKKYKNILITGLVFIVTILLLFYLAIFSNNPLDVVKSEILFYNKDYEINPYDYRVKVDLAKNYEIVGLDNNWYKPKKRQFSVVYNEFLDGSKRSVAVYEVERANIFDSTWKYANYKMNQVGNLTFQETLDLVSKYDITTDFPGKENYDIINYEPLTEAEIQANKERLEENARIEEQLKEAEEEWNSKTPEEQIQLYEERIQWYEDNKEEIIKDLSRGGNIELGGQEYEQDLKFIQDEINKIKQENNLK